MARIVKWVNEENEDMQIEVTDRGDGDIDIDISDRVSGYSVGYVMTREDWQQIRAHIDGLFAAMEKKEGGE